MLECMTECGILLVQPEHVVSLKLTGIEAQLQKGMLIADPKLPKFWETYKDIITGLSRKLVGGRDCIDVS